MTMQAWKRIASNPYGDCRRASLAYGLTKVDSKAYGGWDGDCPGCDRDATSAVEMAQSRGIAAAEFLLNSYANLAHICERAQKLTYGFEPGDLFWIHGSSHGGQVQDANDDERDGLDETICLWDGQLVDDRVPVLLNALPAGIRVLMSMDCCHSRNNWRGTAKARRVATLIQNGQEGLLRVQLMHMAGCSEGGYSYGDTSGGRFTNALAKALDEAHSYQHWFKRAKVRMPLIQQRPYITFYNCPPEFGKAMPLS